MNLVVVDFDRVLYRTDDMKQQLTRRLKSNGIDPEAFSRIYDTVKQSYEYFDPEELYRMLDSYHQGWGETVRKTVETFPYSGFIDPYAHAAIYLMRTLATVILLSQGDRDVDITNGNTEGYQARKIAACHLPTHRTIIRRNKIPYLQELYEEYKPERFFVIDDDPNVLFQVPQEAMKIMINRNAGNNSFESIFDAAMYVHEMLKK